MPRFEPPKPTKRALSELSLDGWENATLPASSIDWHSYAFCYRRAADTLVKEFAVPAIGPHGMFLPILFLYRHYLETTLKGLLLDSADLLGQEVKVPTDHLLTPLWKQLRARLERVLPGHGSEWLDRCGELIEEFQQLDPRSMTFRYPEDTHGVTMLMPGFQISVKQVSEVMKEIQYVLDGAAGLLDEYLSLNYGEL